MCPWYRLLRFHRKFQVIREDAKDIVCACVFLCIWPGSQTWHRGSGNQRRKPCLWGWAHCPPLERSHTAEQEWIHLPGSGGQKQTQKTPHIIYLLLLVVYSWCLSGYTANTKIHIHKKRRKNSVKFERENGAAQQVGKNGNWENNALIFS